MIHDRVENKTRRAIRRIAVCAALGLALGLPTIAGAQEPKKPTPGTSAWLEAQWPDHPEWMAMLVDILNGSQLGPGEGWFKKAVAQTRWNWEKAESTWDKNGDGQIDRSELPMSDPDFARLDRDYDGMITSSDFDFSAHALAPSPGMMLFYAADADGNGKVNREEFGRLFDQMGGGESDFLAMTDFQDALTMRPRRARGSSGGPSRWTLVKGLFRQEIGSMQPGPALDEVAPAFTLKTVTGDQSVSLPELVGPKPVVLVFGNFTCGPFRSQAGNVERLFERYKDRATFVMVYVREAHPTDGWKMESNDRVGVEIPQPQSYDERVKVAQVCQRTLDFGFPMLVDTINDEVGARYSGMPSRFYVIDRDGRIAFKSGRGPFGFKPAEAEQALLMLLADERSQELAGVEAKSSEKDE